jgi:hypothetical protein
MAKAKLLAVDRGAAETGAARSAVRARCARAPPPDIDPTPYFSRDIAAQSGMEPSLTVFAGRPPPEMPGCFFAAALRRHWFGATPVHS